MLAREYIIPITLECDNSKVDIMHIIQTFSSDPPLFLHLSCKPSVGVVLPYEAPFRHLCIEPGRSTPFSCSVAVVNTESSSSLGRDWLHEAESHLGYEKTGTTSVPIAYASSVRGLSWCFGVYAIPKSPRVLTSC